MKSTNIQIIEAYKRHLDLGLNVGSEGNISAENDLILHYPFGYRHK